MNMAANRVRGGTMNFLSVTDTVPILIFDVPLAAAISLCILIVVLFSLSLFGRHFRSVALERYNRRLRLP